MPIATEDLLRFAASRPCAFVAGFRHRLARGVCCPVHTHPGVELVYHASGRGTARLGDGRSLPFAPGSVTIHPAGSEHDQVMDEPGEDLCVQLAIPGPRPAWLDPPLVVARVDDPFVLGEFAALAQGHGGLDGLRRLALGHRLSALLISLLAAAEAAPAVAGAAPPSAAERHAGQARAFIEERFATIGSVAEVAAHLGIGPDHLRHVFRARYGTTLVRRLNEVRVAHARALLADPALPLRSIARRCGFSSQHYFATVFRAIAGLPPGAFRGRG